MAKKVDITEKLSFDENPVLIVGDIEAEVNADAETVLRIMGAMDGETGVGAVKEVLGMLLSEEDLKKITSMKDKKGRPLTGDSLKAIMEAAIDLILGNEEDGGEQ